MAYRRRMARWLVAALLCSTVPLTVELSRAATEEDELEQARNLFRQGLSLEAAGNWAAALSKFEEVAKVKLTPQVRFHIARCKENLGRLNEALGDYRLAEYEAQELGLEEARAITQAREELEARVPTLVIRRGAGAELAKIALDGVELGEPQIGQPLKVDPGPHTIVARLPGDLEFSEMVSIQERETKELELVPPEGMAVAARQGTDDGATAEGSTGSPEADRGAGVDGGPGALPWVVGGVGAASLVASGVFFVLRNSAESELEDVCRGSLCPESAEDTQERGELYATLSAVTLGVGIAGIGAATYLLLTGGSAEPAAAAADGVRIDLAAGSSSGGVSVSGTF